VARSDEHNAKISEQKKNIPALALKWKEIDDNVFNEIVMLVSMATFRDWRPLIYVIPGALIGNRAKLVERARRASAEPEYIIERLTVDEFDIIEP
jgi:hypothetical protein